MSVRGRAVVVIVAIVAAVGALVVWRSAGGSASCSGELRLSVTAAPEIAPVIEDTARTWAETAQGPDDRLPLGVEDLGLGHHVHHHLCHADDFTGIAAGHRLPA